MFCSALSSAVDISTVSLGTARFPAVFPLARRRGTTPIHATKLTRNRRSSRRSDLGTPQYPTVVTQRSRRRSVTHGSRIRSGQGSCGRPRYGATVLRAVLLDIGGVLEITPETG